jgi:predicted ATPase with chaperone activity
MHMATLASIDLAPAGAALAAAGAAGLEAPAAGALAWACAAVVAQATARVKSVVNNLFILRAQSDQKVRFRINRRLYRAVSGAPSPAHSHEVPRLRNYVATQDLMLAVNASITLKRPLLVKGEPGTGKTMLAEEVARR